MKSKRYKKIHIYNVYLPHEGVQHCKTTIEEIYDIISTNIGKNSENSFVCGDFNCSLGNFHEDYPSNVGAYNKPSDSKYGHLLVEFLAENELYATNTYFRHKLAHITTFTSNKSWVNRRNPYRSQIDYIAANIHWKCVNNNSRSYSGTICDSDHRLVKCTFELNWRRIYDKSKRNINIQVQHLKDHQTAEKYVNLVNDKFVQKNNCDNQLRWTNICETCINISESLKPKQHRPGLVHNSNIEILSQCQKTYRILIQKENDKDKIAFLKKYRNRTINDIRKALKKEKESKLTSIVDDINNSKNDSRRMFNAVKELNKSNCENIYVLDGNNNFIGNTKQKIEIITEHFKETFQSKNAISLPEFQKTTLQQKFTREEVRKAIKSLKNNKSSGCDNLRAEHLKLAPDSVIDEIANILNIAVETGNYPKELKIGQLVPLQKPGKKKGPVENLRPIILLSILRKILAICTIRRINDRVRKFIIPNSQCAYSEGRSTTELVFAFRVLAEKAINSADYSINLLMLDMSKAFDTIQRGYLFEDLKKVLNSDELNLIHLLLDSVQIQVKLENQIGELFKSLIGSPQGDAASALFFIIYLAVTLKLAYDNLEKQNEKSLQIIEEHNYSVIPEKDDFLLDQQYADDISWAATEISELENIEKTIPGTLSTRNLLVNETKTEKYHISRTSENSWRNCKLVGSKLGKEEDIAYRKSLAIASFQKLKPILLDKRLYTGRKIQIFQSLVESIFLYNCELWGLTKQEEESIDIIQRRFLRQIFQFRFTEDRKKWPSNIRLYEIANVKPWSETIRNRRLSFFGHLCRLPDDTPVKKALDEALKPTKKVGKKTTYMSKISSDLKLLNISSIDKAKEIAHDRILWKRRTQLK